MLANGSVDDLVELYADDATVEDPAGGSRMRIEPIDVMVFDHEGKVSAMKAYWSAANVTQL